MSHYPRRLSQFSITQANVFSIGLSALLPLEIVSAGLHCDRNISRQILPLLFMLGWYIFVVNDTWKQWRYTRKQFTKTAQLSTSHYSTKYIHFEITCYPNHQIDHQQNNLNTSYTKFCSQLHLFLCQAILT